MKKKILFICSPGLGVLDNWMPIIHSLKNKYDINIFFPNTLSLLQLRRKDILTYFAKKSFQKIFIQKNDNIYETDMRFFIKNFNSMNKKIFNIFFYNKYINFFIRLLNNFYFNFKIMRTFKVIDHNLFYNYDLIFCDICQFRKKSLSKLYHLVKNIKKISINHGPDPVIYNDDQNYKKIVDKNTIQILFTKHPLEKKYYVKHFNLKKFVLIGNPKHDKKWINQILIKKCDLPKKNKKFVFLISRNIDKNYLTFKNKQKTILAIKKIIKENNDFLVVKLHPKEDTEEGKSFYFKYLDKQNYKKNWSFSTSHPYQIAKRCKFAISLFSGVPADLLNINIPTIEYLNLKNLEKNNKGHIFYQKKIPVFKVRFLNLVCGVSDDSEFRKQYIFFSKNLLKIKKKYKYAYNHIYFKSNLNNFLSLVNKIIYNT